MKYYHFTKTTDAPKQSQFNRGDDVRSIITSHLYDDSEDAWREKSMRLQVRRWRKIKNQSV